jgi:hypothetical protein
MGVVCGQVQRFRANQVPPQEILRLHEVSENGFPTRFITSQDIPRSHCGKRKRGNTAMVLALTPALRPVPRCQREGFPCRTPLVGASSNTSRTDHANGNGRVCPRLPE